MDNEEKDINKTEAPLSNEAATSVGEVSQEDAGRIEAINRLQEDIIMHDAIPETSKDTPGSSGAFPVGAFENRKD